MYLEKLEIQGFKSFANKNKLLFSGFLNGEKRGVTVIVGPNGSGKSNIADAIRWVLGEQSTKLLRSKKSEDVIFSGSDKKGRLNMAEVSLFLNNENGNYFKNRKTESLAVDNFEVGEDGKNENKKNNESDSIDALLLLPEIVITRRVFRDGNSEYLINNTKVRLSDIQIFLAKASFGQKTYSVIGQGMVENFLNTSPAERKAFFDEATGVKQYQIKRDISLNKLENSQENLSKVEMLLNEIEPRLKSLTRQVGKLKKRKFLEDELLKNQLNYYGKIWQDLSFRLGELRLKISGSEKDKIELERKLDGDKIKMGELNRGETIGEEFYELQKRFMFLSSEINRAEKQLERISLWREVVKQLETEDSGKELMDLSKEKDNILALVESISLELEKLKDNSKQEELSKLEEELRFLEQERQEKYRDLSKIEAWMEIKLEKQGKFDLSFLLSRQSEIKKNIQESLDKISSGENEIKDKESQIEDNKKTQEDLDLKIANLEREISRINTEESPSNIQKINKELKDILKKIEDQKSFSDSALLKKIILDISSDVKRLLSFSSGDSYRNQLDSISKKIENLKIEKSNYSKEFSENLLSFNISKRKQEDIKLELRKLERELLEVEEKISLNKNNEDLLENKEKKEKIEADLKGLVEKSNILKERVNILRSDIFNINQEVSKRQRDLQNSQSDLNSINSQINNLKSSSIKTQARLEDLEKDIKNEIFSVFGDDLGSVFNVDTALVEKEEVFVKNFKNQTAQEATTLQEKIDNFNQEQEKKKLFLLELQQSINEQEKNINQINDSLNNDKISLAREETRLEDVEGNINSDSLNLDKIKKHEVDVNFNLDIAKEEISRLKNQLEQIGGIDPETEKEYEETQKRFSFLFEQTEDLNKTIKSLEKVIIELDTVIKSRFEKEFKVISEKFNEYFKILFNGGNAKIFPLKDENSLDKNNENKEGLNVQSEADKDSQSSKNTKLIKYLKKHNAIGLSGVDINATPPGKKISSVNMLSGGERALTAIALICAIISANPAPFVVLDEVDAALDEANSERLAKILDDLSNRTQFIVVSHNRATMRKANVLYGVTMESDGVSRLLSVKMDDDLK